MANTRKRKRDARGDGHGDDDDDDARGMRQILPVANLPIDFNGEPMDGLQYLFTVRYVLSVAFLNPDEIASTGEMLGDYPTSSASTTRTIVTFHDLLNPLPPNPPNRPNT